MKKYLLRFITEIGNLIAIKGWGSIIAVTLTVPIPFIWKAMQVVVGLDKPSKDNIWKKEWWIAVLATLLLLLIPLFIWATFVCAAVFIAKLRLAFRLLRTHHVYMRHDIPTIPAVVDLLVCLTWSDWDDVFTAARLHIEYGIWGPVGDVNEKVFIKTYLRKEKTGQRIETEDEVTVKNCFVLQEKRPLIEHYFATLAEMSLEEKRDKVPKADRFLTEAIILDGYLAPQYLIAGLMSQFDEDWQPVISGFLSEITIDRSTLKSGPFKRIQLFTFDCWLLWGPSIPIGNCRQWRVNDDSIIALQYGYGDENNSLPLLPLVGEEPDAERYSKLFGYVMSSPFAFKAAIKVRPVWVLSRARSKPEAAIGSNLHDVQTALSHISGAQRRIRDPRPINPDVSGSLVLDYASARFLGGLRSEARPGDPQSYYSAYVWVIFVLCAKNMDGKAGKVLYPVTLVEAPAEGCKIEMNSDDTPWLGMIPFFEHGNIADDAAYAANKNQLAHKSLATIERLLQEPVSSESQELMRDRYVLRYACASDDANCVDCEKYPSDPKLKSSKSIRCILEQLLGIESVEPRAETAPEEVSSLRGRFSNLQKSVLIDASDWAERSAFSACRLPDIVDLFYHQILKKRGPDSP